MVCPPANKPTAAGNLQRLGERPGTGPPSGLSSRWEARGCGAAPALWGFSASHSPVSGGRSQRPYP